ncbi:DUF4352 domain-containing protein [Ferdinandcohnia sp. Marseille-Q9671]
MKKFSFLFVLVFLVMVVSACGGSSETGSDVSEDGNLTIGETGLFKTDSGDFEVVMNEVKTETGDGSEASLRGSYIVADITVTSKASKAVNVQDILGFKIYIDDTINWNNVGFDKSFSFGSQINGEVNEGDSVTGKIIFDTRNSETYTIELGGRTNPNKLVWEIAADDIQ